MNAHVVGSQLRCNACNQRIRTRLAGYFEPMYPFCPWCGAPVTKDAERLRTCHDAAGSQMAFFSCSACGATINGKNPRFCPGCGREVVDE